MRNKMQNYSKSCDVIKFFFFAKNMAYDVENIYIVLAYTCLECTCIQVDSTLIFYVYFVLNDHQYFKEKCKIILNQFIIIIFSF